jgi:hypothetical protein
VEVYSVNRHNRNDISEVEKSIQSIQVYLKESGLETAPNKCELCIFYYKKKGQMMENSKSQRKGFFGQIDYIFGSAVKI